MKYKCIYCNKEFKQKSHFDVHISRKYSCNKEYISTNDVIINNNILPENSTQKHIETTQKHTKNTQKHTKTHKNTQINKK